MTTCEKVAAIAICAVCYGGAALLGAYAVTKIVDYANREPFKAKFECVKWEVK